MIPLSRTCALAEYAGCTSPATWQQDMVNEAYLRWGPIAADDLRGEHVVLNTSSSLFVPPPAAAFQLRYFQLPKDFLAFTPDREVASVVLLMALDRVEAPLTLLKRAAQDLRRGGLFIATAAYWDAEGPDIATGHEVRLRIYNRISWRKLIVEAEHCGLRLYGGIDWTYHGHALGDHTIASLVLIKEDR